MNNERKRVQSYHLKQHMHESAGMSKSLWSCNHNNLIKKWLPWIRKSNDLISNANIHHVQVVRALLIKTLCGAPEDQPYIAFNGCSHAVTKCTDVE